MHRDDEIRLRHILDAAREAVSFVRNRRRSDLDTDRQLVLAVVKTIEIVGEAGVRVSESARQQLPDIPWEQIIAMRNRQIHAYFDIVWQTMQEDLPGLISLLETALPPASDFPGK